MAVKKKLPVVKNPLPPKLQPMQPYQAPQAFKENIQNQPVGFTPSQSVNKPIQEKTASAPKKYGGQYGEEAQKWAGKDVPYNFLPKEIAADVNRLRQKEAQSRMTTNLTDQAKAELQAEQDKTTVENIKSAMALGITPEQLMQQREQAAQGLGQPLSAEQQGGMLPPVENTMGERAGVLAATATGAAGGLGTAMAVTAATGGAGAVLAPFFILAGAATGFYTKISMEQKDNVAMAYNTFSSAVKNQNYLLQYGANMPPQVLEAAWKDNEATIYASRNSIHQMNKDDLTFFKGVGRKREATINGYIQLMEQAGGYTDRMRSLTLNPNQPRGDIDFTQLEMELQAAMGE